MPLADPDAIATNRPKLTGEQEAIVGAVLDGNPKVVAEALAGTGKTSTLVELASRQLRRRGLYLAFNKSVQIEAEGKFPGWITSSTAHGLAYKVIGSQYRHRLPGNPAASRMNSRQMASLMKIKPASLSTGTLSPGSLVKMGQATVNAFLKTADPEIRAIHIPSRVFAFHPPTEVHEVVLPVARKIWDDLQSPNGKFRFTHDCYLKMWQLTNPVLPWDYIMFDEAQDADPVISAIVNRQTNTQRIWVGDRNQAIYGWRGAIDSMSKVEDAVRLPLTQSWRFGEAIADQANVWLRMLGSPYMVVGNPGINSSVGDVEVPSAILCRGNGTALGWVLKFHGINLPVCLAPGTKDAGKDIQSFAWAARSLMNGEGTDHPDLCGFQTWDQLVKYAEEEEDTADLKRMVKIVNRVGVGGVIDAVKGCVTKDRAVVSVGTAHKAKGLEWPSVRVADDFVPPEDDQDGSPRGPDYDQDGSPREPDYEAMMLNYVTVTRAKERIQLGALSEPGLWDC